MKVILTSFRDSLNLVNTHQWSIARWQPRNMGRKWPELPLLAARDVLGNPLRHLEPGISRRLYEERLNLPPVEYLLKQLVREYFSLVGEDFALLCWCNPDRQKKYPKLYCHRILVGYKLEKMFPWLQIDYRDGAENPIWERR